MKRKDIAVIIVVAVFAGVISILITSTLFVGKKGKELKAETVSAITSDFQKPDPKVFNQNAINPTQLIQIGDNNNQKPL
jgi:archaellin